ncbi:double-strand-break repair protein rad21 [Emericellopsis atlantica]|uniref:Double-strand-break repair protein rad21 n=1 Tax=Emericellopsis atlantica TaxID=2614577 RepID=A0A9P8CPW8_9HYPO|nr:double-strand-break repair protein rad21 [Emericellopsis atlantica]KAG9254998.1 double-strand-break repair protein rad21 [Emericellopsis atlantica]
MFWSGDLLKTNGSLARVWTSYSTERKLSKNAVLQSNVKQSVEEIMRPSHAPFALRLSSQLMIGVVRIHQRKTRYLLDDCNEAMMKIKLAFRSTGNNDMTSSMQAGNKESLLLPDRLTTFDNLDLPPPPDASWLMGPTAELTPAPVGRKGRNNNNRDTLMQEDFDNSQFLQGNPLNEQNLGNLDDLDLDLDFGLDPEGPTMQSVEVGRDAPAPRAVEDDLFSDFDGPLKGRDQSMAADFPSDGVRIADAEGDIAMGDDDFRFNADDQSALPELNAVPELDRARISESPLSDIDEDMARDAEITFTNRQTDLYEPADETETTLVRRPANRARKQRVLLPDDETSLSNAHFKQQQVDRSNITRDTSFLPSDPYLLALMDMQKSGGFVSSILLDGRSDGWAPELRSLLSLEALQGAPELKRKRDSGVADVESEQGNPKSPRIELDEDEDTIIAPNAVGDQSVAEDGTMLRIADDDADDNTVLPNFDDTVAPTVYPANSGPISLGTKHAVHILRDLFGDEAADNEEARKNNIVVFQELLPEKRTSKAEATKMFFECLVLATKDAIKVEQGEEMGAPIRVRGKRGLWGEWAEREAGGEIGAQEEEGDAMDQAPMGASAVAVGA